MEKANNRKRIIVLIAVAVVVLIAAVLIFLPRSNDTDIPSQQTGEDGVLRITVVGDIRMTPALASGARANGSYDFSTSFFGAASLLQDADLTVGNLECSFSGAENEEGWAPDDFASDLAGLGFDVLQTANSYSILGGVNGLNRTMQQIRDAGMETVGTSESRQAYQENRGVYVREINGIRGDPSSD